MKENEMKENEIIKKGFQNSTAQSVFEISKRMKQASFESDLPGELLIDF